MHAISLLYIYKLITNNVLFYFYHLEDFRKYGYLKVTQLYLNVNSINYK